VEEEEGAGVVRVRGSGGQKARAGKTRSAKKLNSR
jgi:hypothetical protein